MIRPVAAVIAILVVALLIIPASVVQFLPKQDGQVLGEKIDLEDSNNNQEPSVHVSVYRTSSQIIEKIPLEQYVRGVVASEMPADFELEALKAQALAARTYIVRRLVEKDFSDSPEGSIVTDTEQHQVYHNEEELKKLWGIEYERRISKINQAVNETVGQVLTYEGKPINATFFSTSNGYTENSEEYWSASIPYLRSVPSPWDKESPRYKEKVVMSVDEFQKKLGVKLSAPTSTSSSFSEIVSKTEGNRVKEVKIEDKVFTGKEIREALGLSSSDFTWKLRNGQLEIDTIGWGHGVGMSQWGANGMAKEGYSYEEIVKYYYKGIEVQDYRQWIVKKSNG